MKIRLHFIVLLAAGILLAAVQGQSRDLKEIQREGVLRHIGVPYANFVTGDGRGFSVELIQRFAQHLGVRYVFVESSWKTVINDLTGKKVTATGEKAKIDGDAVVKGDLIANGLTILPWREKIIDFSIPTFPTQVWLIAGSQSSLVPIIPSGSMTEDIANVKAMLPGKSIIGRSNTCLDPKLYFSEGSNIQFKNFSGNLNELTPAVIKGDAETALLDVPDALVALSRWPGQFKIIGPVSQQQKMAVGFRKDSPHLRAVFNNFLLKLWSNGTYRLLVEKYYPDVFYYYPDFFAVSSRANSQE